MSPPSSASPTGLDCLTGRRDFVRFGSVSAAATLFPAALRAAAPVPRDRPAKASSVLFLWMAGGFTHHESFDPKPDAPQEIRGSLGTLGTPLPGVRFSEAMPGMAKLADRISLVRTFAAGTDDHFTAQARALSGRNVNLNQIVTEPNVGAVVFKLGGSRAGLPGYIAVPGTTRPGPPPQNLFIGGWLGGQYAPFPTGGKPKNEDFTAKVSEGPEEEFARGGLRLAPGLDLERLGGRRALRDRLDAKLRAVEPAAAVDAQYAAAFDMLLSPAARAALDLAREPEAVRAAYGKTKIGARCLLGRRLIEAGAPFVMVDYGYDPDYGNLWDNHNAPGQNFPEIGEMAKRPYHVAGVDRAVSALLIDLEERGLLERTLVVFLTEFGRTPKINRNGGRDHWGRAGSIFFAGGGAGRGRVIGTTDRQGGHPVTAAYGPWDAAATIYAALGIGASTVLTDREGRHVPLLPEGKPIPGVLG